MSDQRHHLAELVLPALAAAAMLLLARGLLVRQTTAGYDEQLADLLRQSGRNDEAIADYRTALQFNPTSVTAPCGLALALAAKGDNSEALRTLDRSLKLHPADAATNEALEDLALKLLKELALPAAQKYYETALRSDPTRANAALGLAKIYLAQNRLIDAGRVLVKPLAAHDRNAALHLQMAGILWLLGRYDQASIEFDTGTARDPENGGAYCDWGRMLIDAHKPEKAEIVLRRALELAPDNAVYHMHLARSLRDQGLFTEAMNEFTAALDKDIRCIPVYLELALTFRNMHDEKATENFLRQGMAADPASVEAKSALATFLTDTPDPLRRNLWEAAALLQTCVNETHEQNLAYLNRAAEACARVEVYERALEFVEKAIAWAKLHDLDPEELQKLLARRQQYVLALAPPMEGKGNPSPLAVEGMHVREAIDIPWPDPLQPDIGTLIDTPMRLSQPPGP